MSITRPGDLDSDEKAPPPGRIAPRDAVTDWAMPILTFFAIRLIGVAVLARFADLHGTSLPTTLQLWDGRWMVAIARYGYGAVPSSHTDAYGIHTPDTAYAFFPGYPYLAGAVAKLPGLNAYGGAIIVTLASGALAAVAVTRIGRWAAATMMGRDADEERVAAAGYALLVLFAAAPMAVVLSMAYTEALFCALVAWALVGVIEKRWLLAGFTACAAGLVRPTGIVIIAVVMLAAFLAATGIPRGKTGAAGIERGGWPAWAAILVAPLGYLGYLGVVWRHTGSPLGWFEIQTAGWGTQFDWGRATFRFVNYSLTKSGEVAPVATSLIVVATLVLVAVNVASRTPWPLLLYGTLVTVSICASSGLMMSRARLLLPAFVLLVPVANVLARQTPAVRNTVLVGVIALSSWFGAHMLTVYPHAM
ncbi:hypothetical protein [Gordonia crocea]|uniref:Membrane protein n=1 Tax=Gordonia crocea TaxID=589162 RepID=A0A7M3SV45_9ACTN|nr:hypothetical protein [Gordonia crocea]GED96519.1 membrane protein [Gordonia crocea]